MQEAYPIENEEGQVVGGMLIETNLLESERFKRRSEVFQRMLKTFQLMALRGEPEGIDKLDVPSANTMASSSRMPIASFAI